MRLPNKRTLINTKNAFTISIIVITLTILSVWFYGFGSHKTVIENSLISTSILSISFFLFISISLYNGVKLKDNVGELTDQFDPQKIRFFDDISFDGVGGFDIGEGIGGIIVSIIVWFVMTIILSVLFYLMGTIIWFSILIFLGMLYWIFFRALRLIFKKSAECSGNVERSVFYGFAYTLLYNFWIYGIILLSAYLGK